MSEPIEHIEPPSDEEIQDFIAGAEDAPYNTILRVWREVLAPAEDERKKRITPQWANRICSTYRGIEFYDMPTFRDRYFDLVRDLALIVDAEIDSDAECLNASTPEEDAEQNTFHYINVIINWQKVFLTRELDWECEDENASIDLAVLAEVHKMFFDQTGLTSLLDNIPFEFTDADRDLLAAELEDLKEGR
jgi:hypothetical protein